MTTSPYETVIKLSAVDGISGVLALIAGHCKSLESHFKNLTTAQKGLAIGFAGRAGGVLGATAAIKEFGAAGDKLLDQQDKLQRAGVSLNEALQLQAKYYNDVARAVPTSTASGYLKTYNELRSVVGAEEAAKIAPWSMKLEAIIASATGKSAEGEGFKMWRAMEMTGRSITDVPGTQKLANALAQDIIGSGGKLDASTYQAMAKRGGVAWANATPEFLAGPMSVVGADLGGDTAGTAMMSAYMFLKGSNTLSKQRYATMKKAGLIDPSKVTTDKGGRVNVGPGGIRGSEEFASRDHFDLFGWQKKYLNPALEKLSAKEHADVDDFLAKIGRNRNVFRMLEMFNNPDFLTSIAKDLAQWKQALGVDAAYQNFITQNPIGVKLAFWDQLESLKEAIGKPIEQNIVPFLRDLTGVITRLSAAAYAHPRLAADIAVAGGGALGGAALGMATGGFLGMSAGPLGALAGAGIGTGIGAIAGGLTGLAIIDFPAIKTGLGMVGDGLRQLFTGSDLQRAAAWKQGAQTFTDWLSSIDASMSRAADAWVINPAMDWAPKVLAGILRGIDKIFAPMEPAILKYLDAADKAVVGWVQRMVASIRSIFGGAAGAAPIYGPNDKLPPGATVLPEKHSSLVPPQAPIHLTIQNINQLDGRKLAQSTSSYLVASATYPTSASGADSRGTWMGPSYNPTEQG